MDKPPSISPLESCAESVEVSFFPLGSRISYRHLQRASVWRAVCDVMSVCCHALACVDECIWGIVCGVSAEARGKPWVSFSFPILFFSFLFFSFLFFSFSSFPFLSFPFLSFSLRHSLSLAWYSLDNIGHLPVSVSSALNYHGNFF